MTMNDIPEAHTTWCDPDEIGAPLPETDEVEACLLYTSDAADDTR